MAIDRVLLKDFLRSVSPQTTKSLPLVHTTQSSKLIEILNNGRLLATECNIFQSEKLCYLFVGRPSYKYEVAGEAPYWMLPTVFVVRFQIAPKFKRIYPFDSGAFTRKRLPDYITTFARDDFECGDDIEIVSPLISAFFGSEKRYWHRQVSSEQDFRDQHELSPLHMQIEALNRLYGDKSNNFDDRAASIETQLDKDVPLSPADVLGVVVPEEFLRDSGIKSAIQTITPNVESYGIHPVNVSMYFALIYDAVQRVYAKFGLMR